MRGIGPRTITSANSSLRLQRAFLSDHIDYLVAVCVLWSSIVHCLDRAERGGDSKAGDFLFVLLECALLRQESSRAKSEITDICCRGIIEFTTLERVIAGMRRLIDNLAGVLSLFDV